MPQINCSRQLGIARYHLSGRKLLAEDETERNHQRHGRCSVDVSWLGSLIKNSTELRKRPVEEGLHGARILDFQCLLNSRSLSIFSIWEA